MNDVPRRYENFYGQQYYLNADGHIVPGKAPIVFSKKHMVAYPLTALIALVAGIAIGNGMNPHVIDVVNPPVTHTITQTLP